jgi:hypothetical protein
MGTRQFQDGDGGPLAPGEKKEYVVNHGDVHKALRGILAENGLNNAKLDEMLRKIVAERVDARINHLLSNSNIEGLIFTKVQGICTRNGGEFTEMVKSMLRQELARIIEKGLTADVYFGHPPRTTAEPPRRIIVPNQENQ